jgi:hypothetical protein
MHPEAPLRCVHDAWLIRQLRQVTDCPIGVWRCPCHKDCLARVLYARCLTPGVGAHGFCYMANISYGDDGWGLGIIENAADFDLVEPPNPRAAAELAEAFQGHIGEVVDLDKQQILVWLKHGLKEAILSAA